MISLSAGNLKVPQRATWAALDSHTLIPLLGTFADGNGQLYRAP